MIISSRTSFVFMFIHLKLIPIIKLKKIYINTQFYKECKKQIKTTFYNGK